MCYRADVLQEYKVSERRKMSRGLSKSFIHVLLFTGFCWKVLWAQWV